MSLARLLAELKIVAESTPVPATAHHWGSTLSSVVICGCHSTSINHRLPFCSTGAGGSISVARLWMRLRWTWFGVGGRRGNVEYRRAGCGGGVPQTWDDALAAVRFLDRIDAPVDRSRMVTIGHSAGGHLALWCASSLPVIAAVSLARVCDLTVAAAARLGNDAVTRFIGCAPSQCPAAYAAVDLVCRLPTAVPQLLVHGGADDVVPVELSRRYAALAHEAGHRCQLIELSGVGHFEFIDPRTAAWETVLQSLNTVVPPDGALGR
jgi:pimeloyl-ACP methyl ester carboxylesterase